MKHAEAMIDFTSVLTDRWMENQQQHNSHMKFTVSLSQECWYLSSLDEFKDTNRPLTLLISFFFFLISKFVKNLLSESNLLPIFYNS